MLFPHMIHMEDLSQDSTKTFPVRYTLPDTFADIEMPKRTR